LLNDGVNTYTYDPANRLSSVTSLPSLGGGQSPVINYHYNGLGDRLQQTIGSNTTTYLMDLNAGLSQVLDDGTNTYLYGNGRIAQSSIVNQQSQMEYFLGDALGSVRQLTSAAGNIVLANAYDPYGNLVASAGTAQTSYGFTGEYTDPTGSLYLRARYYTPETGRFMSRDTWGGNQNQPMSYNKWAYVYDNSINLSDPTGMRPEDRGYCDAIAGNIDQVKCEQIVRGIDPIKYSNWTMSTIAVWDAMGLTPDCPLYITLPLPVGSDMSLYYGFWFHYLLYSKRLRFGLL
jgi:RHS repeat-associated protein